MSDPSNWPDDPIRADISFHLDQLRDELNHARLFNPPKGAEAEEIIRELEETAADVRRWAGLEESRTPA